jgi:hypothetical protein
VVSLFYKMWTLSNQSLFFLLGIKCTNEVVLQLKLTYIYQGQQDNNCFSNINTASKKMRNNI